MLTVNYVDDDDELMRIYDRAGVTGANTSGINAVLFDDDEGVGVCKMVLRDEGILIVSFDVAKDKAEDPSVSDFFFRTILFKLSMSEVNILIAPDDRLEKFGFKKQGDLMVVAAFSRRLAAKITKSIINRIKSAYKASIFPLRSIYGRICKTNQLY